MLSCLIVSGKSYREVIIRIVTVGAALQVEIALS